MNKLQAMRAIWQAKTEELAQIYGAYDIRDIEAISWEWVKWLDKEGDEFMYYDLLMCWEVYTRETSDNNTVDLSDDLNDPNKLPF